MSTLSRRDALRGGAALAAFLPLAQACAPARTMEAGMADPDYVDGVRLAQMVATGETTALETVNAAIARTESVNPRLNALANETFAGARAAAEAGPEGVFSGVPSFFKDLYDQAGVPTLYGSRAFEGYVATRSADFVRAWQDAGIVSLGKTTTPEIGLMSGTEPLVTGPTRNPWNTDRTPGGSSGGAAALVAARVTPFAHATDGGGSIRIPASCCGLFGMKPSRQRLLDRGGADGPPEVDISVSHAVTLTVRDSVALFRVAERPRSAYAPLGAIKGPSSRRLRIAYAPDPATNTRLDPDVRPALDETATLCRDLGHEVIDLALPFDGETFARNFLLYWAAGAADFAVMASKQAGQPIGPDILEPLTLGLVDHYESNKDAFPDAVAYLKAFEARYEAMFEGFDVLLSPTLAKPPLPIGAQDPRREFDALLETITEFAAYTSPMNVAGAASMSVPLGWTPDGLPVGSMFSGRRGDDGMLFELAYELEEAKPWIGRRPPVRASAV